MTRDILYGDTTFKPYFNMQKFEDRIYNRSVIRERRIKTRKKLRVLDKLIMFVSTIVSIAIIVLSMGIAYKTVLVKNREDQIKKLEVALDRKRYENNNVVTSLKNEMKFDDIKMKAYMELNMITPTENNIIRFNKSDNGFVRQYESIR